jgi:hypothetical protein
MAKLAEFEKYLDNATKPGPEQLLPGIAVAVVNKDGVYIPLFVEPD